MTGVKWIVSGDGGAARAAASILAVAATGTPITVEWAAGGRGTADAGDVLRGLVDRRIAYDRVVLDLDPAAWPELRAREAGRYAIGVASWDTDSLPAEWRASCDAVDEVWVPSAWDAEVFAGSRATSPVITMPPCLPDFEAGGEPPAIDGLDGEAWVFYSVLDWSERSNPADLVIAYLATFTRVRDVVLALAVKDPDNPGEELLRRRIVELKREIQLSHYARIMAFTGDRARIRALHARGDGFVQLSRGGGWDAERFAAAARGKPVVASDFGGAAEYLGEDVAYPVPVTLRPVENMPASALHLGTQLWAQPDVHRAGRLMRRVYENRHEARRKGAGAAEQLARRHAPEVVAARILERFEEISRRRRPPGGRDRPDPDSG